MHSRRFIAVIFAFVTLRAPFLLLALILPSQAAATPERNVYYTYDAEGHQLTATYDSPTGTEKITNTYDGFGELRSSTSTSGGAALTLSYLYDADGNRVRLTFPDANFFTYSYDGLDRESGALQGGTTSLLTITYDQLGRRSSLQRTGAGKTAYAYDNASRLQSLTDQLGTAAGGANDQAFTFGYYASDQIKSKATTNSAYSWTSAASTNRPYTINGLNQYTAAGSASFAYDANGNLTQSSSTFYCYDTENRLVGSGASATDCSSLAVLAYDPLGRLVTTQASGTTTRLVYDGDDLVAEYNGAGTLLRRYIHGPTTDDPLVQYEGAGITSTVERLLYSDAQGSIIATTDNAGNLMLNGIDKYDEYGIPQTDSSGHSLNSGRFQYTGQQWIGELGMYYYKARFYSPTLGRFFQTDPVGYQGGINIYEYDEDDPVDHDDPSGLQVVPPESEGSEESTRGLLDEIFDPLASLREAEYRSFERELSQLKPGQALGLRESGPASETALRTIRSEVRTAALERATQLERGARSLDRRAALHDARAESFARNPTVRPGMEGRNPAEISNQQRDRIAHLRGEAIEYRKAGGAKEGGSSKPT